jgi:hypothetical protein
MRISLRLSTLVLGLALGCGTPDPQVVRVIATDYALQAPDSVPAGIAQLAFENRGRVPHEVVVGLLRPGAGIPEMMEAGRHGLRLHDAPEHYLAGAPFGALFAWPGETSPARLTVELLRGQRYALLCTFRDSVGAPQHVALGMVRILSVW